MIVTVRDLENNLYDAAAITALIAGVCSIAKSKKTLVLQFTNAVPEQASVLNILSGRDIRENSIRDLYNFQDDGLDAILLRAETADLSKEHYNDTVTKLLTKENMFDVFRPTAKSSLLDMTKPELLKAVITHARDIYEYIFLMLPSDSRQLLKMAKEIADENIVIVPQGKYAGEVKTDSTVSLIVKEYEPDSKFDLSGMRKRYKVRKLYTVPHNVGFKDAVITENLLDFILTNRKTIRDDDNYMLTASISDLLSRFVSADTPSEDEEAAFTTKSEQERRTAESPTVLPESAVQEVMTVRKGLFRKKKNNQIMIDLPADKERSLNDGT